MHPRPVAIPRRGSATGRTVASGPCPPPGGGVRMETTPPTPHGSVPPSFFGLGQATFQLTGTEAAAVDKCKADDDGEQQCNEAELQARAILADVSSTVQNPANFLAAQYKRVSVDRKQSWC